MIPILSEGETKARCDSGALHICQALANPGLELDTSLSLQSQSPPRTQWEPEMQAELEDKEEGWGRENFTSPNQMRISFSGGTQ